MNDTTNNGNNEQLVKIMAVVGFVVMVCLLAWLAVQFVRFMPTLFGSLASVFESNQRELEERTDDENVVVVVEDDNDDVVVIEDEDDTDVIVVTPATSTPPVVVAPVTPAPTPTPTPAPQPIQYKTVVTYKTPVSDPNGTTDLAVTFVGVGSLNSGERFVLGALPSSGRGAMQFTVKNIGTKTSTEWNFSAKLPNGSTSNSRAQLPLKPNESSTLTIVFEVNDNDEWHSIGATITGGGDINSANNGFSATLAQR